MSLVPDGDHARHRADAAARPGLSRGAAHAMMYGFEWDTSTPPGLRRLDPADPADRPHGDPAGGRRRVRHRARSRPGLALLRRSRCRASPGRRRPSSSSCATRRSSCSSSSSTTSFPISASTLPAFLTGALALGLQYSAYTSEVYRGGIEAIPRGQWEAATALNLTRMQIYRDIVVPQIDPAHRPGAWATTSSPC